MTSYLFRFEILRFQHRISRLLITAIALGLIQVITSPIIAPKILSSAADAATLETSGLILNWDTADSNSYSGSGTTINDLSGNSSAGTLTSTGGVKAVPSFNAAAPKSLTVSGNSSVYNFIRSGDLKPKLDGYASTADSMQNVSIFTWVYPTAAGIVIDETSADNGWQDSQIELAFDGVSNENRFSFRVWGSNEIISNTSTPLSYWYYVGLTYDFPSRTLQAFINGKKVGEQTLLDRSSPWELNSQYGVFYSVGRYDPTNLGSASAGNFQFGSLHIYKRALSQETILNNYQAGLSRFGPTIANPTDKSTLVNRTANFSIADCGGIKSATACTYKWEESTNGGLTWSTKGTSSTSYTTAPSSLSDNGKLFRVTASDSGAIGNVPESIRNYAISTSATLLVSQLPGSDTDTAVNTSGTQFFYAAAANTILPGVLSTVTMEAWVNPSTTCDGTYFCSILASNYSFILDVYQGKIAYIIGSGTAWCNGGGVTYVANGLVPSGSWTHVAMVRNSANVKIYINGNLVSDANASCVPTTLEASSSQQFRIGSRDLHDQHFYGSIDEVRIWTTDRSASIASDMHSNETSTSGLTNYWNFNEGTGGTAYNRVPAASSSSDLISYGSTKDSASFWDADSISSASTSGAYSIRTFKRSYISASGGWKVPAGVSKVTALVVGGGGGAGFNSGGGGSGGGVSYQGSLSVSGNIAVTVGMGGRGATSNGTATAGTSSTFGATNAAGGNGGVGPSGAGGISVSGSGAGGAGSATSSAAGGNGGNGPSYSITGVSVNYAGGGGGGGWIANSVGGTGGSGGGGAGGGKSSSTGNNGASGSPNTGGGGGGGSVSSATSGNGGSGIIIIRWITATAPIFTGPVSDTLTAGLVETFTVSGSPISPLTRGYRWQVSTDTGTTWVNAATGSGFTSASYTTPTLETTTSGVRYQYRVVVTDSDTAGLFIVETSTAVYLIVNPRITITGSSISLTQKYSETQTVTYSITNGTGTRTTVASPNNRTGITWSSVSGSAATLGIDAGLGFGTYYETLTVTDSVTATTTQMITIAVSKADTITVTATPSTTTYNGSAITPTYVISGLKNGETATATSNFLGINGTTYGTTTTPPTNAGSYRFNPSDIVLSVGASLNNYQGVTYESATVTINKAFQAKLGIGQYDAFPGISSYPINVYGGTGLGEVTRTLVDAGTANCALSGSLILTATQVGTCSVRAVKDGGINYFAETTTATIYWITFVNRYASAGPTTPTDLGLSGSTGFEIKAYETFTVLSFANGSGTAVTSATKGSVMRVIGTGFNSSDETTEVIIGFFSIPKSSLAFDTTNPLANYVEFTLPNSSDLEPGANDVAMKSRKGWAFAPGLLNVTG